MITLLATAHIAHLFVTPPQQNPKVKFGQYQAELRIPEGGLFAQEQVDVEFRIVDTTKKDPVEEGFKGVGAIDASGTVTMPSMPGMPTVKLDVHREGVPGDYGMVLFFAHGGQFKIDLNLKIPGETPKQIAFMVDVKDERPTTKAVQPFKLNLIQMSLMAQAGKPTTLALQVVDTKTNKVQTSFDTAHERKFHLLIASKDLNWFRHEHPVMDSDGIWRLKQTFPAGGEYWIYGDVAPTGKGSRVLITKIKVSGPKPSWNTNLVLSSVGIDQGLKGVISTQGPIKVGQSTQVMIKLFDFKGRIPASITETYLGAVGHLMIFSKDGQTAVHSHPVENKETERLSKQGVVKFTARFPKSGLYKAYAQFKWRGAVRTIPFTIEVKK